MYPGYGASNSPQQYGTGNYYQGGQSTQAGRRNAGSPSIGRQNTTNVVNPRQDLSNPRYNGQQNGTEYSVVGSNPSTPGTVSQRRGSVNAAESPIPPSARPRVAAAEKSMSSAFTGHVGTEQPGAAGVQSELSAEIPEASDAYTFNLLTRYRIANAGSRGGRIRTGASYHHVFGSTLW